MKCARAVMALIILMPGCIGTLADESSEQSDFRVPEQVWERKTPYSSLRSYKLLVNPATTIVELQFYYVGDRLPPQTVIDAMILNLEELVPHKEISVPEPIQIEVDDNSTTKKWTLSEIYLLATEHWQDEPKEKFILQTFILSGLRNQTSSSRLLVGEYVLRSIFIYPDIFLGQEMIFRHVAVHEMGHAIGLVNNGIPMVTNRLPPKEKDPCQCHSMQEDSPMFYEIHVEKFPLEMVFDNQYLPYKFNDDDLADIHQFINSYN